MVEKSHDIASRSLLMVENETGNIIAKIRDPGIISYHASALFILQSRKTQQDITNFKLIGKHQPR